MEYRMEWNDATVQTGVPMPEIIMTHGYIPKQNLCKWLASYAFDIHRPNSYFCVTTATLVVK